METCLGGKKQLVVVLVLPRAGHLQVGWVFSGAMRGCLCMVCVHRASSLGLFLQALLLCEGQPEVNIRYDLLLPKCLNHYDSVHRVTEKDCSKQKNKSFS